MLELVGGGVLGSLLGGLFRLAPELFKLLDKRDERRHELMMFEQQVDLEKKRGQMRLEEIGAERDLSVDTGVVAAFDSAIRQQADMVKAAGRGWVASLSASVRPVVTYWVLAVWTFIHLWFAWQSHAQGAAPDVVFKSMMSADFAALVAGTINYWFLDRTLKQRGL